ncbi:MAG: methionyl-tRNA formyltransferase [bacterium]
MRIIFAGSPGFAVPSLERLVASEHQVVAVVTQPARPRGRGLALVDPPVKTWAAGRGLTVFQPEKFNSPDFLETLAGLRPDLVLTAAYGRIFRRRALGLARLGCVNLHASLLPKYRGVAPVNWAIMAGEAESGVTTFFMDEGVDTGDVIESRRTEIGPDETAGDLLDRLAVLGADLVVRTCELVASGSAPRLKQDQSQASYAPKLSKQDGRVAWSKGARAVHDHIRGVSPWPGAFSFLKGEQIKIIESRLFEGDPASYAQPLARPGEGTAEQATVIAVDSARGILLSCGVGLLWLKTLQAPGKKPTAGADFARGRRIEAGDTFG